MTRRAPAHRLLFLTWMVSACVLLAGLGLLAWTLPLLHERANLRALLRPRLEDITLGQLLREAGATPAERDQIRQSYAQPEQIDLDRISWNLRSRPTPFVGAAPDPGLQTEGAINQAQLRDEREIAMPKPDGVYRIFLTGGSFAYGVGLPDPRRAIARRLQEDLTARPEWAGRTVEVWNAAMPAWSSTHERIWIANYLSELAPDLVIMLTGTNEAHWGYGGMDVLHVRTYEEDLLLGVLNEALIVTGGAPMALEPPRSIHEPVAVDVATRRFLKNVRLAALALQPEGAALVVALQPSLGPGCKTLTPVEQQWVNEERDKVDYLDRCFAAFDAGLSALAARQPALGLRLTPLRGVFTGQRDPLYIDLYHVVDKGNALVASALGEQLTALRRDGRL